MAAFLPYITNPSEKEGEENELSSTIPLDRNQKVLIIYHFGHNDEDVNYSSDRMTLTKFAVILQNVVSPLDHLFGYITLEFLIEQAEEHTRVVEAIEDSY